ncbi:hypothetical protein BJ508DRAFT_140826 [Ascobolus immersus RN42]|uniref:Uncharacterized protein n=1 Tax=Ascobolus immersus RN42 TaxID=1160509 RepID=A0A3N4I0B3_ASCIM|nr:hypothetical protein BJ508DRAFT_140826 [Ascobolus immersus RN42]
MASSNPATIALSQPPLKAKERHHKPSKQFEKEWKDVEGTDTPVTWSLDPFLSTITPYLPTRIQPYLPTFTKDTCLSPCVEDLEEELRTKKDPKLSDILSKDELSDPDASTISSDSTSSSADFIIKKVEQLEIESDSGHEAGSEYSAEDEESTSDEASIPPGFLKTLDLRGPIATSTPPIIEESPSSSVTATPARSSTSSRSSSGSGSSSSTLPFLSPPPHFLDDSDSSSRDSDSDADSESTASAKSPRTVGSDREALPAHPNSAHNACLPTPPAL